MIATTASSASSTTTAINSSLGCPGDSLTSTTLSWGYELWDQFGSLSEHTAKGIEFMDKYNLFMKERCAIETEYVGKLKRLVKHHQLKRKDEEDNQYTYCRAFIQMLQEVTDLANQHEVIAENISSNIVRDILFQLKELKNERKEHLTKGHQLQQQYTLALNLLDKSKKSYEKAFKESERALEAYHKADADLNLSRAEVEKAKNHSITKGQICEDAKTEYANQLQKTNDLQRRHFTESMPEVFNALQQMEERRIACIQSYMKQSAQIQKAVFPIIDRCLEGIIQASEKINAAEDSALVIERYKSGNLPPDDIPFEDLSNPSYNESSTLNNSSYSSSKSNLPGAGPNNHHLNYSNSIKSETLRGTLSVGKFRKRGGIFGIFASKQSEDYAELPPNQRRKKLLQKIDQIQTQINQETAVRDGLLRMKAAYEANPSMGDPASVEGQLTENSTKMEKLMAEKRKFEGYLESASESNGKPITPVTAKKHTQSQSHQHRNSLSEESLSRSASDSSFSQHSQPSSKTPTNNGILNSSGATNDNSSPTAYNVTGNNTPPNSKNANSTSSQSSTVASSSHLHPNNLASNGSPNENSPESGISTSHTSIPDVDYVDGDEDTVQEDAEFDVLPVLGKARALYPFEPQSEGSIGMDEGEELEVVELDQGDGWTRVRRITNEEEGFVPTSYIDIEITSC